MLPDFKPDQFNIKLNSGPSFHPSRVRREGDDPITLAILLDVSGDQSHLLPALSKNFSNWIATSFKPQDRISIFALDRGLVRTDSDEPPIPFCCNRVSMPRSTPQPSTATSSMPPARNPSICGAP